MTFAPSFCESGRLRFIFFAKSIRGRWDPPRFVYWVHKCRISDILQKQLCKKMAKCRRNFFSDFRLKFSVCSVKDIWNDLTGKTWNVGKLKRNAIEETNVGLLPGSFDDIWTLQDFHGILGGTGEAGSQWPSWPAAWWLSSSSASARC